MHTLLLNLQNMYALFICKSSEKDFCLRCIRDGVHQVCLLSLCMDILQNWIGTSKRIAKLLGPSVNMFIGHVLFTLHVISSKIVVFSIHMCSVPDNLNYTSGVGSIVYEEVKTRQAKHEQTTVSESFIYTVVLCFITLIHSVVN